MIRKFLNSNVAIVDLTDITKFEELNKELFYIQNEKINDNLTIFETCLKSDVIDLIPFTTNSMSKSVAQTPAVDEEKLQEYGDTILNNDPFYKYSGCKLSDIILAKDVAWIQKALKEMRNEFIKTRIEYLAKATGLI